MPTQRKHASPSSADDASGRAAVTPHPRAIDTSVTEWTVDLGVWPDGPRASATTSLAAAGFVDFDAVESLHPGRSVAIFSR